MRTKDEYIRVIRELRKNLDRKKVQEMIANNKKDKIYSVGVYNNNFLNDNIKELFQEFTDVYASQICELYIEMLTKCQKDTNMVKED